MQKIIFTVSQHVIFCNLIHTLNASRDYQVLISNGMTIVLLIMPNIKKNLIKLRSIGMHAAIYYAFQ